MKKKLLILLLFCFGVAHAQNNPYAVFGYSPKTILQDDPNEFLTIQNQDKNSKIKSLTLDPIKKIIWLKDAKGSILDTIQINSTEIKRFLSTDPHADKYAYISPYAFCNNNPVNVIDPDGRDIIFLFYATGKGQEAFQAAAQTRMDNIMNSKGFDGNKDKVFMMGVSDLGKLKGMIEGTVSKYGEQYGQTREVGFWSHSGQKDGPIGSVETSQNALEPRSGQMSMEGWGNINYNWKDDGAKMDFYGCNTACNSTSATAFSRRISDMPNYSDVEVSGQTSYAYPSFNSYSRSTNLSREYMPSVGFSVGDTYMVGGNKNQGGQAVYGSVPANQMGVYRNGTRLRSQYQRTGY
jgi:hypothetical protein